MALAMPSMQHEAVVELLRDAGLVRVLLGIANVNVLGTPQVADATLTAPEMRADLVVLFGDSPSRLAVVIEVQRNRDAKKKWASRMRGLRARLRDG